MLVETQAVPLPINIPADASGKAVEYVLGTWAPATIIGDLDMVLGSWFQLGASIIHWNHLGEC